MTCSLGREGPIVIFTMFEHCAPAASQKKGKDKPDPSYVESGTHRFCMG